MNIYLWPYSKKKKNIILKDILESNVAAVFHNPGSAVEQIEFVHGEIREFIPSFEVAKEKFKSFEYDLHVFYDKEDKKSQKKIESTLKKNKVEYVLSEKDYPI